MNQEKVARAVELQERANQEIDLYGEASSNTIYELMDIVDSLTPEECDEFIKQRTTR